MNWGRALNAAQFLNKIYRMFVFVAKFAVPFSPAHEWMFIRYIVTWSISIDISFNDVACGTLAAVSALVG